MHAPFMLKLTLCARFLFCVTIWFSGEVLLPIGFPVVFPMAMFLNVENEQNWTGPVLELALGLKWALKDKFEDVAEAHGGIAQYLNARFATYEQRELLREKLFAFAPHQSDKEYLLPPATGNPPVGSAGYIHIAELGFLSKCTVRSLPQFEVCSDIFDDILENNFQSISNPLVVTQLQLDAGEFPYYGFVKGMARSCTVVALVVFLIDAGLPPSALSPEFEMSVSAIHCEYHKFSSAAQILLVNNQMRWALASRVETKRIITLLDAENYRLLRKANASWKLDNEINIAA